MKSIYELLPQMDDNRLVTKNNRVAELKSKILEQSSQCVKCGMCLSSCPTYKFYKNEARSPRGRISLMRAIAEDEISPSKNLKNHLDSCLHCLACERSCPSQVQYGSTMDLTKELWKFKEKSNTPFQDVPIFLQLITKNTILVPVLRALLYVYQKSRVNLLIQKLLGSTALGNMEKLLPPIKKPINLQRLSHNSSSTKKAQLFLGCISQITDQNTSADAIKLLEAFGIKVIIPKNQSCCGAMHLHTGNTKTASEFTRINSLCFSKELPLLYSASGCKPRLNGDFIDIKEVCEFLSEQKYVPNFKNSTAKVLLHSPCTLRHNSKDSEATFRLLSNIPGINIRSITSNSCCGAAGLNMLKNPKLADGIVKSMFHNEPDMNFDILLTSNIGCSMHIRKYLKKEGINVTVMHPVNFLAEHLLV